MTINHSSDIDYKDFVKIYRGCTKEPYNFLTIDTTQPVDKRFKKKLLVLYKNDPNKLRSLMTKLSKIKQTMICTDKILKYLH